MLFLLSEFGLLDGTSAPVIPVIELPHGAALPLFFPLLPGHPFIGLSEEVHHPPKYPETLRLQVAIKVLPGIPFFKNTELIFIVYALAKVAVPASILFS